MELIIFNLNPKTDQYLAFNYNEDELDIKTENINYFCSKNLVYHKTRMYRCLVLLAVWWDTKVLI